jgi:hypothetical protein
VQNLVHKISPAAIAPAQIDAVADQATGRYVLAITVDGLSRTSIADEMREEHRRRILGE